MLKAILCPHHFLVVSLRISDSCSLGICLVWRRFLSRRFTTETFYAMHQNPLPKKLGLLQGFRRQSLTLHPAQHWKRFCDMVHAFAGFRCAIVVASIGPPGDRGNHSMSAIHWNQCDGKVVCQNSWGCNLNPFIEIHSSDSVRGWVVEVVISSTVVPKDGKQQKIEPPPAKM